MSIQVYFQSIIPHTHTRIHWKSQSTLSQYHLALRACCQTVGYGTSINHCGYSAHTDFHRFITAGTLSSSRHCSIHLFHRGQTPAWLPACIPWNVDVPPATPRAMPVQCHTEVLQPVTNLTYIDLTPVTPPPPKKVQRRLDFGCDVLRTQLAACQQHMLPIPHSRPTSTMNITESEAILDNCTSPYIWNSTACTHSNNFTL